jgi:hypothetical protein
MIPIQERVGADIGNGNCTLSSGKGSSVKTVSFRSTYVTVNDEALANYSDSTGHYLVGDDAIKIGAPQRASTDSSFYSSERFRILLCYGLTQLGVKNPAVMIGLPVENFQAIKQGMVKQVRAYDQMGTSFKFNTVLFCEQPYGALSYPGYKINGEPVSLMKASLRLVMVDIGDGTTDVVGYYRGSPLPNERAGRNFGVSEIHETLLRHLKSKYTIDSSISTHDIDQHLRNGKPMICLQGRKEISVDLKTLPIFKKAVQDLVSKVFTLIRDNWTSFGKIDHIVFAGGFMEMVSIDDIIKKQGIPESKCLVPDQPGEAIAQGIRVFLNLLIDKKVKDKKNETQD